MNCGLLGLCLPVAAVKVVNLFIVTIYFDLEPSGYLSHHLNYAAFRRWVRIANDFTGLIFYHPMVGKADGEENPLGSGFV